MKIIINHINKNGGTSLFHYLSEIHNLYGIDPVKNFGGLRGCSRLREMEFLLQSNPSKQLSCVGLYDLGWPESFLHWKGDIAPTIILLRNPEHRLKSHLAHLLRSQVLMLDEDGKLIDYTCRQFNQYYILMNYQLGCLTAHTGLGNPMPDRDANYFQTIDHQRQLLSLIDFLEPSSKSLKDCCLSHKFGKAYIFLLEDVENLLSQYSCLIKSLHSIQDTEEPNFRRILSHRYNKSADWARASVNAMAKPGFIPGSIEFAFGDKNGAKHDWIHSPSQFGRDLYRCWNSNPFNSQYLLV